ncbi:MAG: GWxTD domain-containing protein [Bacteroidetes bacterium]|nr:GWxTD domain-containing protein [Bacteroidota bacterium]
MKKIILILVLISICNIKSSAQNNFSLSLDYSRFQSVDQNSYVEFYFAFDVTALTFKKFENEFKSESIISFTVKNENNDSLIAASNYRAPFSLSDTSLLKTSRSYIDINGLLLKPGLYRAILKVSDYDDLNKRDSISKLFVIEKKIENNFIMTSDLELCSSINNVENFSDSRFIKNTYEVKPNPSNIYSKVQPILFYYIELYNSSKKEWQALNIKTTVTNISGDVVLTKEHFKQIKSESVVDVGAIQIFKLRTGSYQLNYTIIDTISKQIRTSVKRFFIYNKDLPSEDIFSGRVSSVISSEYAALNDAECNREYDYLRYLINKTESDKYKKLKSVESKREFLFEYWKLRDSKYTGTRSAKVEYMERIKYANNMYKSGFKEGWKSDKGRTYILYGQPDEVERRPNELAMKPYEVWYYHSIQGGVQFIFGDRTGYSDYVLLHSTHRDELHDENWQMQIQSK